MKMMSFVMVLFMVFLVACKKFSMNENAQFPAYIAFGTLHDHEGNQYKTIQIGNQTWLAENFRATTFRNGDYIPFARGKKEWIAFAKNGTPAWCFFRFDSHFAKMGIVYNWYAINDSRGLAPYGYHVPMLEDWQNLMDTVNNIADTLEMASRFKTLNDWVSDCSPPNNSTGFSAVPAGRIDHKGNAEALRNGTSFWTANTVSLEYVWSWRIQWCQLERELVHKGAGAYLRFVKI